MAGLVVVALLLLLLLEVVVEELPLSEVDLLLLEDLPLLLSFGGGRGLQDLESLGSEAPSRVDAVGT